MLRGHIARANPLWREYQSGSEALAIFQGPETYISPSLYPSKQQSGEVVPTWDYAVVHARGELRFIHDAGWLRDLVSGLTNQHEASQPVPWKISDAPDAYIDEMLTLIVGFEIPILALNGKWKVSQNRSAVDRQGVVRGLQGSNDPDSREIAAMLATRDPPDPA
jgi:transcriptional regulator